MTLILLRHLLIGATVSFIGSMPPGTVNMMAVKISLTHGYRSVATFALASATIEFLYGMIAVYGADFFLSHQSLNRSFELISVVVFFALGIYYFLHKEPVDKPKATSGGFIKGLTISLLNPMGIPFWLAYTSLLQLNHWISISFATAIFYSIGIALGAFLALSLFGFLAKRINRNLQLNTRIINRTVGLVLVLLAVVKLVGLKSTI